MNIEIGIKKSLPHQCSKDLSACIIIARIAFLGIAIRAFVQKEFSLKPVPDLFLNSVIYFN
jgi:hypothetical protein